MHAKGYKLIINMLDDFLVIERTEAECWEVLFVLLRLLRKLGFAINYNKVKFARTVHSLPQDTVGFREYDT